MNAAQGNLISIAPLLQRYVGSYPVTVNAHQSGFMQSPDGRQMYVKNTVRRHIRRGRTHVIVG